MAIYHASMKVIGRSSGRSAVASAAYRAGTRLTNERDGITHDYTRKGGVLHAEILGPENTPDWMFDREILWNSVERVERRKDAQLARELEIALPRELSAAARIELVRSYASEQFVLRGMIVDFAIHDGKASDGGEQPHAHIMLTMRELTGDGFGKKQREWNAKDLLKIWREKWAEYANTALEKGGFDERIDHRTLEAQRAEALERGDQARADELDREPEPKLGPVASDLENRGQRSDRGDVWRAVRTANDNRRTLRRRITEITAQLRVLEDRLKGAWARIRSVFSSKNEANREDSLSQEHQVKIGESAARIREADGPSPPEASGEKSGPPGAEESGISANARALRSSETNPEPDLSRERDTNKTRDIDDDRSI